jgi:hypothetical protein
MRKAKTLTSLVVALVLALTLGGYAYAEALGFESDLSEDGVVNVCNPNGVWDARVATAIKQWNAVRAQRGGTPTLRELSGKDAFCEVRVEEWSGGGGQADFYAHVEFREHPDRLQISDRFTELPVEQRQSVITHEFGHVLGLDHPPADVESCAQSIMTTITECRAVGVERRLTPGPYDEAELRYYWVEEPIYPVPNKCWDSACSNWGPPGGSTFGPSSRDGGGSGDRKEGTGGSPSSTVQTPKRVIND